MPFAHDQYTINWLIIGYRGEYHSSVGGIHTRACGARVNASRQARDILRYSMINLYIIDSYSSLCWPSSAKKNSVFSGAT